MHLPRFRRSSFPPTAVWPRIRLDKRSGPILRYIWIRRAWNASLPLPVRGLRRHALLRHSRLPRPTVAIFLASFTLAPLSPTTINISTSERRSHNLNRIPTQYLSSVHSTPQPLCTLPRLSFCARLTYHSCAGYFGKINQSVATIHKDASLS
jgi:hypothetical protein